MSSGLRRLLDAALALLTAVELAVQRLIPRYRGLEAAVLLQTTRVLPGA